MFVTCRAEELMKELDQEKLRIRKYCLTDSPLMARIIGYGIM